MVAKKGGKEGRRDRDSELVRCLLEAKLIAVSLLMLLLGKVINS